MRISNLTMASLLAISLTTMQPIYAQEADLKKIDILMQQQDFPKALEETNAALVANPSDQKLIYTRIVLYKLTNQQDKAAADFDTLIATTKNEAQKHSLMAYKDAYFGRYGEAKIHIDEAILLDPKKPDYYADRAEILMDQNPSNSAEAFKDIDKALELNPDFFGAYFARARIYEKLGDKQKAAEDFATAQKLKAKAIAQ